MLDEIGEMRASGEIGEPAFRDLTADVFNPKVTENEAVLRIKLRQGYERDLRGWHGSLDGGYPEDISGAFEETYGEGREELLRLREQAWKEHAGLEAKARESGEELSRYDAYYRETRPDKAPSYDPFGQAGSVPEKPPETEFMDAGDLVRLAEHRNDEAADPPAGQRGPYQGHQSQAGFVEEDEEGKVSERDDASASTFRKESAWPCASASITCSSCCSTGRWPRRSSSRGWTNSSASTRPVPRG